MTKYEELMAIYEHLIIEERPMKNKGLYADDCIWINKDMPTSEKICILAEELGHYHTTVGNILNQKDTNNIKQELVARRWAYETILPIENIYHAVAEGYTEIWNIAEHLGVEENFLKEALMYYRILDSY